MKISLVLIGKTDDTYIKEGFDKFQNRLKHYIKFETIVIPDIKKAKNLSELQQKQKEGELILSKVQTGDFLVLLDEKGKDFTSVQFSEYIQKKMLAATKHLIFVIGGPYGFHESVYQRANQKIALSKMTFSHQMVRLIFIEQLYRAFTILKGEPYHHI